MKFVASRDFSNVKALSLKIENAVHPGHIHKGARFEIGTADKAEELEPADKEKVLRLHHAKCVVPASDTLAVKKIDAELKIEQDREARTKGGPKSIEDQISAGIAKGVAEAIAAQAPKK